MRWTSPGLLAAVLLGACATAPERPPVGPAERALWEQARAAMEAGEPVRAEGLLLALLRDRPGLAGPWANLGLVRARQGDTAGAVAALERALALDPGLGTARNHLALLHRRAGRFDAAERVYRAGIEHDGGGPLLHYNLGVLYDLYLQRPRRAAAHYRMYLELSDGDDKEVELWIRQIERRLDASG